MVLPLFIGLTTPLGVRVIVYCIWLELLKLRSTM